MENEIAAAAVEFLILWIPIIGTLIFLIEPTFFPGKLIFISNFENL